MNLFDVYPLFNITPAKAQGSYIWDDKGEKYLDLYGGHAVISIGHSNPYYVQALKTQLDRIAFYSNSVQIPLQQELANKLGALSGYPDYNLFLCNSGAEANENALKLASFHTGRKKIIAFTGAFHGRTSLAVAATDDSKIVAPVNETDNVVFLPFNDEEALEKIITTDIAAVIIEGMQGVGGVMLPALSFLKKIRTLCNKTGALMVLDEVQSGYGRTGLFFAHQNTGVIPDLITVAKGMGNGFPVAGVLIAPHIKPKHSMLGTTFGGNYLACVAAIAVLDVIKNENLVQNAFMMGNFIMDKVRTIPGVKEVRGRGLMIGIDLHFPCAEVRNTLLYERKIFTGSSSNKNTLRILPALNIARADAELFLKVFEEVMEQQVISSR